LGGGAPGCEFHRRTLNNEEQLNLVEAGKNVVDAACRLVMLSPSVEDLVLECANIPPTARPLLRSRDDECTTSKL
jgi:hypothetical protein